MGIPFDPLSYKLVSVLFPSSSDKVLYRAWDQACSKRLKAVEKALQIQNI